MADVRLLSLLEGSATDQRDVDSLKQQVAALQRTVATLVDVLCATETLDTKERERIRKRVLQAARPIEDADTIIDNDFPLGGSPYRDVKRGNGMACNGCGKLLDETNPELTDARGGRVCISCFTRVR